MHIRLTSITVSIIAAGGFMAASEPAFAAIQLSAQLPITAIITGPQGGFLLLLPASNWACGSSGNQFNVTVGQVGMTADGAKAALAVTLMAYAQGKLIRVYFDPAIAGCPVQQVYIEP
jgi:hypothetical protein